MADAYKTLYQDQLPNSVATLVTVGGAKSWIVKHISIVNNGPGNATFQLFRNGTTAAFAWSPPLMSIVDSGMAEWDGTEALASGETFAGVASVASQLTITITGDEVS